MKEYTCGSFGVKFGGFGGTWRAVERHEKGFLLWESELHGPKVKKLLTDKVGNVLLDGVTGFSDFSAMSKISEYERIRDSITCDLIVKTMAMQKEIKPKLSSKKGEAVTANNTVNTVTSTAAQAASKRPEPRKASGKDPHIRESVISKLHEYQTYVDSSKKKAQ